MTDPAVEAANRAAENLLRTDPAEYFRRTRVQAQWFRPDPEALRLLDEEHRRLARKERHWEWRAAVAAALHRVADRIYREDEL